MGEQHSIYMYCTRETVFICYIGRLHTESRHPEQFCVQLILRTWNQAIFTSPPAVWVRVCVYVFLCLSVSLCVCPLAYLKNTRPNVIKFSAYVPPLTKMRYVVYFWFCGNGSKMPAWKWHVCFVQFPRWRHQSDVRQRCLVEFATWQHRGEVSNCTLYTYVTFVNKETYNVKSFIGQLNRTPYA